MRWKMLEKMGEFFDARLQGYEDHQMTTIESAEEFYPYTAGCLPQDPDTCILDLGCGTGLELDHYLKAVPTAKVTGIDLAPGMLDALRRKFPDQELTLIQGSYFDVPFSENAYDAAVSVESLHHFTKEEKTKLYAKLRKALKPGGYFILTDYFALSEDEERSRRAELLRIREEQNLPPDEFYHYDTPLTVQHETEALLAGGFESVEVLNHWGATYTLKATAAEPVLFQKIRHLYNLEGYTFRAVPGHEGGRNRVLICSRDGEKKKVLRLSALEDRNEQDYLAETEFVHYLSENGAPVADVIPSVNGNLVEVIREDDICTFAVLFAYAKGILLWENGYRYREGAPLEEYFYNTGKVLGRIHRLSKSYQPKHRRASFPDKYNQAYMDQLIPDSYSELRAAIVRRLNEYRSLPVDRESFGLVHFDFSDINFHIDMETGDITVFDFDNCIYCWYMFDLAHLWMHGVGWYQWEKDPEKRMAGMAHYFDTVLSGYHSETDVAPELLEQLPLFIDMVLIENVVDEFECAAREGGEPDPEDIENAVRCLTEDIPYAGVGM